jgi:hypothetical protein
MDFIVRAAWCFGVPRKGTLQTLAHYLAGPRTAHAYLAFKHFPTDFRSPSSRALSYREPPKYASPKSGSMAGDLGPLLSHHHSYSVAAAASPSSPRCILPLFPLFFYRPSCSNHQIIFVVVEGPLVHHPWSMALLRNR